MKASELMIDDWVLINGTPRKIQAVDGFDDEIMSDDELYTLAEDRCHSEDKVDGVPITPEILEKNGWVHYEDDKDSFHGEDCVFLKQKEDGYGVCIDKVRTISGIIHYVHELQHALRLCGIEKEIEL